MNQALSSESILRFAAHLGPLGIVSRKKGNPALGCLWAAADRECS